MKYIAFYEKEDYKSENRSVAPAAADVVRYMADVMSETEQVEIICPARTLNRNGWYKGRSDEVDGRIRLTMPPTFGARTAVGAALSVIWTRLWLLAYLMWNTKRGEVIVAYHSMAYITTLKILKVLKKIHLILEIREIYSDVNPAGKNRKAKELSYFQAAEKYIFPTELMNELINNEKKPHIIATGVYTSEPKIVNKESDGVIHVVYAGTLSVDKGGAEAAIRAAEYLPEGYHVHILGYGTEKEIEHINKTIGCISERTKAKICFHGVLRGKEFTGFLQSCQIGLATQDIRKDFNNTSFPSKILVYLSNYLEVVSGRIQAVETSGVGNLIHYYEDQNPKSIADAILRVKIKPDYIKSNALLELDAELKKTFSAFLEK